MAVTPAKMALYAVIVVVTVTIRVYILIEPFACLCSVSAVAFKTVQ